MSFTSLIGAIIDFRSFSNLWYWLALAFMWSNQSHWILGVPFDMVRKMYAYHRKGDTQEAHLIFNDIKLLLEIRSRRFTAIIDQSSGGIVFTICLLLTLLGSLSFYYRVEVAQSLFFMFVPLIPVGWLKLRFALYIKHQSPTDDALIKRLTDLRLFIQFIGFGAIFITALFGMWRNLSQSVFY